jgi:NAD(P)-dependent dehydrogenase (short-subunit alcohol dehydrogenase family)
MENNPFCLKNKVIIVTGASSGIGRQCAISCASQGARVVILGRDRKRLDETLSSMKDSGNHLAIIADLTDFENIEAIIKGIVADIGKTDGLINCAGISTTLPVNLIKPEKIEEFLKVNVVAAINLTRSVVKPAYFSDEGGSVIFISSVMGVAGEIGKTIYSLTKGALISGAKSMALELAPRGIRVNCISPGVVESPMSKNAIYSRSEESLNKIKALHPLGLGHPEDVANACVFLLSDASRWVTGTNLIVDGGYLAR